MTRKIVPLVMLFVSLFAATAKADQFDDALRQHHNRLLSLYGEYFAAVNESATKESWCYTEPRLDCLGDVQSANTLLIHADIRHTSASSFLELAEIARICETQPDPGDTTPPAEYHARAVEALNNSIADADLCSAIIGYARAHLDLVR